MKKTVIIFTLLIFIASGYSWAQSAKKIVFEISKKGEKQKYSYELRDINFSISRDIYAKDTTYKQSNYGYFYADFSLKKMIDINLIRLIADPALKLTGKILITDNESKEVISTIELQEMEIYNCTGSAYIESYEYGPPVTNRLSIIAEKFSYDGVEIKK